MDTNSISYGDEHKVALADLPAESIHYLCQRGLAHYLGNQMAARVTAEAERRTKAAKEAQGDDFDPKTFVALNDAERATLLHDYRQEAFERLLAGDVGTTSGGPRGDELTREVNRLAEIAAKAWARSKGVPWAKVANQKAVVAKFAEKADIKAQAQANIDNAKNLGDEIDLEIETA